MLKSSAKSVEISRDPTLEHTHHTVNLTNNIVPPPVRYLDSLDVLRPRHPALLHLDHPATSAGLLHGQIVFVLLLFVTRVQLGKGTGDLKVYSIFSIIFTEAYLVCWTR